MTSVRETSFSAWTDWMTPSSKCRRLFVAQRILAEPQAALTKQYSALLGTEGVQLDFRPDAVRRLAELAFALNERQENIGARRLSTVLERLLDQLSFEAPQSETKTVVIDAAYVDAELGELAGNPDLSRYIL